MFTRIGTSRGHRLSISSSEGVGGGLENSTLSVPQRPSSQAPSGSRGANPSRSPIGRLTDKIRGRADSTASVEDESVWVAKTNYAWDIRLLVKRRITNLFVSFSSLKSYIELNYSGFRKILKKRVLNPFKLFQMLKVDAGMTKCCTAT